MRAFEIPKTERFLVLGEEHGFDHCRALLLDNLKSLKSAGFDHIFFEFGKNVGENQWLDDFLNHRIDANKLVEKIIPTTAYRTRVAELMDAAKDERFCILFFNDIEPNRDEKMFQKIVSHEGIDKTRAIILTGLMHSTIRDKPKEDAWKSMAELLAQKFSRDAILNIGACNLNQGRLGGVLIEKKDGLITPGEWNENILIKDKIKENLMPPIHPFGSIEIGDDKRFGGGFPASTLTTMATCWNYLLCYSGNI